MNEYQPAKAADGLNPHVFNTGLKFLFVNVIFGLSALVLLYFFEDLVIRYPGAAFTRSSKK